jgi:predicted nucleic acid-binding protein
MKSNRSFSLDIEEARRRLEVWRKSRSRGKRIPDRLWALAAALARTHGVSLVSQRLGLKDNMGWSDWEEFRRLTTNDKTNLQEQK